MISGPEYSFCIDNQWVYHEHTIDERETVGWTHTVTQSDSTASLTVPNDLLISGGGMRVCNQPYISRNEFTNVFGATSCHNIQYCSDGSGYVASDGVADCSIPIITSISSDKPNGTYSFGTVIDIDITFSEPVS